MTTPTIFLTAASARGMARALPTAPVSVTRDGEGRTAASCTAPEVALAMGPASWEAGVIAIRDSAARIVFWPSALETAPNGVTVLTVACAAIAKLLGIDVCVCACLVCPFRLTVRKNADACGLARFEWPTLQVPSVLRLGTRLREIRGFTITMHLARNGQPSRPLAPGRGCVLLCRRLCGGRLRPRGRRYGHEGLKETNQAVVNATHICASERTVARVRYSWMQRMRMDCERITLPASLPCLDKG